MLYDDGIAIRCAIDTVAQIDRAVSCLARLVKELQGLAGDKRKDSDDVRERAYFELDFVARRYLRGFSSDRVPSEYCREWRIESKHVLLRLGRSYISGAPSSRFAYEKDEKDGKSVAGAWSRFNYWLGKELDLDESEQHEETEG